MAAAPPTRPRGTARREALLDAVLRIVAETGPDAVTHRRVAEVAELPLASTTYWFSSKDDLLAAALELAAARDIDALRHRAAHVAGWPPLEAAAAVICAPLHEGGRASRASLIAAYALWLEAARRPELRAVAQRWTAAYHETVAELLTAAGSSDPVEDARLLVAAGDGLLMEQLADGSYTDLRPSLVRVARGLIGEA
jgi:DNA-binding transcriptional regulator YbjK